MGNWWDTIGDKLSGVVGGAVDAANTPIGTLAMLYFLQEYINNQQNKNYGTNPYDAAVSDMTNQRTNMQTMLSNAMSGQTTNPAISTLRTALADRAYNNPLASQVQSQSQIAAGQPARYNQSAALPSSVMANLQSLTGNRGADYQNNASALNTQLANRFGTRDMRSGNVSGALTPYRMASSGATPAATVATQLGGNMPNPSNPGLPMNLTPMNRATATTTNTGNMPSTTNPGLPMNLTPMNRATATTTNTGNMPSTTNPGLPMNLLQMLSLIGAVK